MIITQEQLNEMSQYEIYDAGREAVESGDIEAAELCLENLWRAKLSEDLEDAISEKQGI